MKKLSMMITGLFVFMATQKMNAQGKLGADYFIGTWNVLVKATPNGDAKLTAILEKGDTSVIGSVLDSTGTELSKLSKVTLKDSTVTVYFTAQGYDVYLVMNKKDEDHVSGMLMDMFDSPGERVKKNK